MVRDRSTLICLSVPGGMITGRERKGDVIIIIFFKRYLDTEFISKRFLILWMGKIAEILIMNVKPPGNR